MNIPPELYNTTMQPLAEIIIYLPGASYTTHQRGGIMVGNEPGVDQTDAIVVFDQVHDTSSPPVLA